MKTIVFLLAGLMLLPAQAGEVFRWVDKAGAVHYGDEPPRDADDVERKKLSSEPSQNEDLPYETRVAQQNFPVTLYVTARCGGLCAQARALLNKRGIPFSEKVLRTKAEADALKELTGFVKVPVLAVGKTFLEGFREEQWTDELEAAGYPKTAPERKQSAPASPDAAPADRSQVVPPSPE